MFLNQSNCATMYKLEVRIIKGVKFINNSFMLQYRLDIRNMIFPSGMGNLISHSRPGIDPWVGLSSPCTVPLIHMALNVFILVRCNNFFSDIWIENREYMLEIFQLARIAKLWK